MDESKVEVLLIELVSKSARIEQLLTNLGERFERHEGFCREDMGQMWQRMQQEEKKTEVFEDFITQYRQAQAAAPHWLKLNVGAIGLGVGVLALFVSIYIKLHG
jgi:hypothetical protein